MIRENNRRRQFVLILVAIAGAMLLFGCAYFNSFYNTKKYFEAGEKERLETTEERTKTDKYKKSIEAGSKLIEYYPESEYIDDALFIMGCSYYWMQDYHKGRRKFEELQANYPESPFIDDSRMWMGKTFVKLKMRQEATNILRGLIADTDDPKLLSGSQYALAELYLDDSLFTKAEEEFLKVLDTRGDDATIGEALWFAGNAAMRVGRYKEAEQHYDEAIKHKLSNNLIFRIKIQSAKANRLAGDPKRALKMTDDLLSDKRYFTSHPPVRIERALALHDLGRYEEALEELERINLNNARTAESAQAYYLMGLWAYKEEQNEPRALEMLQSAITEKTRSLYSLKADTLKQRIDKIHQLGVKKHMLNKRIKYSEQWISNPINPFDTLKVAQDLSYDPLVADSLGLVKTFSLAWKVVHPENDSTAADTGNVEPVDSLLKPVKVEYVYDPTPVLDTLAADRGRLQTAQFNLGELLLFDMADQDSAKTVFEELTVGSVQDSVKARAYLALAYIAELQKDSTRQDSLMALLARDYVNTRYGAYARAASGADTLGTVLEGPDSEVFKQAEQLYSDEKNYDDAYSRYRWIIDRYPSSPYVPRALYAAALISGRHLDDLSASEELLSRLAKDYPTTPQGFKADLALQSLRTIREREMADSLGIELESDIDALTLEEVDLEPVIVGGIDALSSVLNSDGLLPNEVMQGTGGEVMLRYVVNDAGEASEFRVVLEDPPGKGLARALIRGLQEVNFSPGRKDGKPVKTQVEYRYALPLDAPPNVRPLPRGRGA